MIFRYQLTKNERVIFLLSSLLGFIIASIAGYLYLTFIPVTKEYLSPKEFSLTKIECYGKNIERSTCLDRWLTLFDSEQNRYNLAAGLTDSEVEKVTNNLVPGDLIRTNTFLKTDRKGHGYFLMFGFETNNNLIISPEQALKAYNENTTVWGKFVFLFMLTCGFLLILFSILGINILILPFAKIQSKEVEQLRVIGGRNYIGAGLIMIFGYVLAAIINRFVLDSLNITSGVVRLLNYVLFFSMSGLISAIYLRRK